MVRECLEPTSLLPTPLSLVLLSREVSLIKVLRKERVHKTLDVHLLSQVPTSVKETSKTYNSSSMNDIIDYIV